MTKAKAKGQWHHGKFPLDGSLFKCVAVSGAEGWIEEDVRVCYRGLARWDPDCIKSWDPRFNMGAFVKETGERVTGKVVAWFEEFKD